MSDCKTAYCNVFLQKSHDPDAISKLDPCFLYDNLGLPLLKNNGVENARNFLFFRL